MTFISINLHAMCAAHRLFLTPFRLRDGFGLFENSRSFKNKIDYYLKFSNYIRVHFGVKFDQALKYNSGLEPTLEQDFIKQY